MFPFYNYLKSYSLSVIYYCIFFFVNLCTYDVIYVYLNSQMKPQFRAHFKAF